MKAAAAMMLAALALLGACGSGGKEEASERELRIQVAGDREETAIHDALAAAFEKVRPGVRVRVDHIQRSEDHIAKLATAAASGSSPDVFTLNYREYAPFAERGALVPLDELLRARRVPLNRMRAEPFRAFTLGGALQCLPLNASSMVVFVNPSLFQKRGVPLPARNWSWDDFARTARQLSGEGGHGVGFSPRLQRLAPFVWSAGGELVDDQSNPSTLQLASPEALRAIQLLVGLVREGAAPSPQQHAETPLEDRFAEGRLAMLLSSRREVPMFRERTELEFDVVPPPRLTRDATILHTDGYCISRGTGRRGLAADYLAFAVGPQAQSLAALSGRIVPVLPDADPLFLDPARAPRSSSVFLDQLPVARTTPAVAPWPQLEDEVGDRLERLFSDVTIDVAGWAREADRRSREILARR